MVKPPPCCASSSCDRQCGGAVAEVLVVAGAEPDVVGSVVHLDALLGRGRLAATPTDQGRVGVCGTRKALTGLV